MIRAEPCFRCGARASCRHREVEDVALPPLGRLSPTGSFIVIGGKGQGNKNSPWGAKGNPAGVARRRILDAMKAQLR